LRIIYLIHKVAGLELDQTTKSEQWKT